MTKCVCVNAMRSVKEMNVDGTLIIRSFSTLTCCQLYYACCSDPYPDVTFTIIMKRRPMFYLFHLLFPCVILTAIGLMTSFLPPESGEKVSLAVTVLLAMTVFMLVIMENIPPTSEVVPLFGGYALV